MRSLLQSALDLPSFMFYNHGLNKIVCLIRFWGLLTTVMTIYEVLNNRKCKQLWLVFVSIIHHFILTFQKWVKISPALVLKTSHSHDAIDFQSVEWREALTHREILYLWESEGHWRLQSKLNSFIYVWGVTHPHLITLDSTVYLYFIIESTLIFWMVMLYFQKYWKLGIIFSADK